MAKIRPNRAHEAAAAHVPEPVPEWEPYGRPGNSSTLERHTQTGEIRVAPNALRSTMDDWAASACPGCGDTRDHEPHTDDCAERKAWRDATLARMMAR